jgi:phenylpyruvate tautomerase PptA (4-oxalocrotonate tautomerase family)
MGYYLIQTPDELEESLSQLVHRLTALARRIAALKQSTTPIVLKQLALEIEPPTEAAR